MHVSVLTDDGVQRLEANGNSGTHEGGGITVALRPDADGSRARVVLAAPQTGLRLVCLHWHAPAEEGTRFLGDHWERGYGDLECRGLVPERKMPWYFLAYDGNVTHGVGVATGTNAVAWWTVDGGGVRLWLHVANGGKGVLLGDRELHAATVIVRRGEAGESPFTAARAFAQSLCPNPRLPAAPVYGGNDWYYAYGNNSDDSIRRDAALIRDHSPSGPNHPFMVIDAGWFPGGGCDGGPYDRGNAKFPNMPRLAADMKAINVRPGIWIRPLLRAESETPEHWCLPDAHPLMATRKNGGVFLDPTLPDVQNLVAEDIRRLADWGYELIKHDFTTYDIFGRWGFDMNEALTSGDWTFADRSRTTAEIIRDLYQTIRDAAGDDTLLIGCNTIGHLGAGVFELQRTGDDTSGREWDRTRKMGVNTLAFRMAQHDTFFAADADCVGLTKHIPWHLNRAWLDLLARSGTPLFVSADPVAVGPEQSAALKEAFALAAEPRHPAEPLDWLDTVCPRRWRFADGETATYDWYDGADEVMGR